MLCGCVFHLTALKFHVALCIRKMTLVLAIILIFRASRILLQMFY